MALKLLITNKLGISTEYHRITGLELDNKLKLTVLSYTDETYREKEKDTASTEAELKTINSQIDAELAKPEEERDIELIIELTNRNNEIVDLVQNPDARFGVYTVEHEFPKEVGVDITFEYLYEKLKELPEFEDAEDV